MVHGDQGLLRDVENRGGEQAGGIVDSSDIIQVFLIYKFLMPKVVNRSTYSLFGHDKMVPGMSEPQRLQRTMLRAIAEARNNQEVWRRQGLKRTGDVVQ